MGWILVGAFVGCAVGFLGCAVLTSGKIADLQSDAALALEKAVKLAAKKGYDDGWDNRDLIEKRRRTAAALQAAATRKRGAASAS